MNATQARGDANMLEFVPFDDCWFDTGLPGPLVPLPTNFTCVRLNDGAFHWAPEMAAENVIASPSRIPSRAAVPAFSSST